MSSAFSCTVLSLFLNCLDHLVGPSCSSFMYQWGYGRNHTAMFLFLIPLHLSNFLGHINTAKEEKTSLSIRSISLFPLLVCQKPKCILTQSCSVHLRFLNKRLCWIPVSIWILLKPHAAICSLTMLWYLQTASISSALAWQLSSAWSLRSLDCMQRGAACYYRNTSVSRMNFD